MTITEQYGMSCVCKMLEGSHWEITELLLQFVETVKAFGREERRVYEQI